MPKNIILYVKEWTKLIAKEKREREGIELSVEEGWVSWELESHWPRSSGR